MWRRGKWRASGLSRPRVRRTSRRLRLRGKFGWKEDRRSENFVFAPPISILLSLVVFGVAGCCRWVKAGQRRSLLVAQFRMRERLTRDHFVSHGGVVDEDGLDGGDLLQVGGHEVLVGVHVRMVCARLVIGVV